LYTYEIKTDATDQHILFQIWLRWWKRAQPPDLLSPHHQKEATPSPSMYFWYQRRAY